MNDALALLSSMPTPDKVRELEAQLIYLPQVDLGTQHLIHGGIYARTVLIPADTVITGALMAVDNVCVMCGDITVTTDAGTQRLTGFHVLPAIAGFKRVGVAHADTWWTTLIPTQLTNTHDIEDAATHEASSLQSRRLELDAVSLRGLTQ